MIKFYREKGIVYISIKRYFDGCGGGIEKYIKNKQHESSLGVVAWHNNDCIKHIYYNCSFNEREDKKFVDIFLGD